MKNLHFPKRQALKGKFSNKAEYGNTGNMKKFYSTKELTKILPACRQTIYKDLKNGKLSGERIGRGYQFSEADIQAYRKNCRVMQAGV